MSQREENLLNKRKVDILEAIVTYLLTAMALNENDIICDINSLLMAIDPDAGLATEKDFEELICIINLSRLKFASRMMM